MGQQLKEVCTYSAAELLIERVIEGGGDISPSNSDAGAIAEICNRLDGIPLAIELAASRVSSYGFEGVASLLGAQFGLLWRGRRNVLQRHRTLGATLDWSYNLLPEFEKLDNHRYCLEIDKQHFSEIREDEESRINSLAQAWWMTLNEKRKATGLGEVNVPEGNQMFVPTTLTGISSKG